MEKKEKFVLYAMDTIHTIHKKVALFVTFLPPKRKTKPKNEKKYRKMTLLKSCEEFKMKDFRLLVLHTGAIL